MKYYTLESFDGIIYIATLKKRAAKKLLSENSGAKLPNEGVCYKNKLEDPRYKKPCFMW